MEHTDKFTQAVENLKEQSYVVSERSCSHCISVQSHLIIDKEAKLPAFAICFKCGHGEILQPYEYATVLIDSEEAKPSEVKEAKDKWARLSEDKAYLRWLREQDRKFRMFVKEEFSVDILPADESEGVPQNLLMLFATPKQRVVWWLYAALLVFILVRSTVTIGDYLQAMLVFGLIAVLFSLLLTPWKRLKTKN